MKAYSEKDLIGHELKHKTILQRIFVSQNVEFKLLLPKDIYLRASVLCDDIYEMTEIRFKLHQLIEMLWVDFIDEVREHQNIKHIYNLLLEYDRGTPNLRFKAYYDPNVEEVPLYPVRKRAEDDSAEIFYCRLKRKLALRGEVMLSDIALVYPNHPFSFERVLEILLIDFISKYGKGEAKKIVKEFLDND